MLTLILAAWNTLALTFAALFPIINPIGVAPIFLSLTNACSDATRKLLARKIAFYGFLLVGGSLTLGSAVLAFFGISLPIIQLAGGFVLSNTGWAMLNHIGGGNEEERRHSQRGRYLAASLLSTHAAPLSGARLYLRGYRDRRSDPAAKYFRPYW